MEIEHAEMGGIDGMEPPSSVHAPERRGRRGEGHSGATESLLFKVQEDQWDWDSWQSLLAVVQSQSLAQAVPIYSKFLDQFPTHARGWKQWAEHSARSAREGSRLNRQGVGEELKPEVIYQKALRYCKTNVELWRSYLDHITRHGTREEILAVYDQAVTNCGLEPSSHIIWSHYIDFVAKGSAHSGTEEQVNRDLLRRVHQRAVKSPIKKLDIFWKQYEEFENEGMNPDLARGILNEIAPLNKNARQEVRARSFRRGDLVLNAPAFPPRGKPKEEEQSKLWRKYIAAESGARLEAEELNRRVTYAHELAIVCLYRYPDAWIEAANYHKQNDNLAEAESVLSRGLEALPLCPVLHFALAHLHESNGKTAEAQAVYERLIERAPSPLAYIECMRFTRRTGDVDSARKVFARARKDKHSCTFQLFVAAAHIELYVNKMPPTAKNIFELGMKTFSTSVEYALAYIDFLWHLNDEAPLRNFFERFLAQLPKGIDSRRIWDKYHSFECTFGTSASIESVERRRSEALSLVPTSGDEVLALISRTRMMDLIPVTHQELNSIQARANALGSLDKPENHERPAGGGRDSRTRNDSHANEAPSEPLSMQRGIELLVQMFPKPPNQMGPPVQTVIDLILATPDTFPDKMASGNHQPNNMNSRKRKGDNLAPDSANKNKDEEMSKAVRAPDHRAPVDDIYRNRRAQKAKTK